MDTNEYTVPNPLILSDQEAQVSVKVMGEVTIPKLEAEIKKLELELFDQKEANVWLTNGNESKKQLISELGDWLESQLEHMGPEYKEAEALIERARKIP